MNPFVADPEWGWWITLYFFLGGISAGLYFVASLIELFGAEEDRPLARIGYRLAFPLICLCGIFLIVDLKRPDRFWHMLFQSEVVDAALQAGWPLGGWGTMLGAPLLKWWSPMSIGAWAIGLFSVWSFISYLLTYWQTGFLARWLGRNACGYVFHAIGSGLGFFVAAYTGVLLSATNQPVWSQSEWIAPLFLTSASSTALALLLLLGGDLSPATRHRLERADLWALGLELFLFLLFLASLRGLLPLVLHTWQGWVLVAGTMVLGLLAPLALHFFSGRNGSSQAKLAAASALLGGFLLRYGIVNIGPALLHAYPNLPARDDGETVLRHLEAPLAYSVVGLALIAVTAVLAIAIPLLLRQQWALTWQRTALAAVVSVFALAGVLCYAVRPTPARWSSLLTVSPEEGRVRGGGFGASLYNRPAEIHPRTKIPSGDSP